MKWFDVGTKKMDVTSFGTLIKLMNVQCTETWVSPWDRERANLGTQAGVGLHAEDDQDPRTDVGNPQEIFVARHLSNVGHEITDVGHEITACITGVASGSPISMTA